MPVSWLTVSVLRQVAEVAAWTHSDEARYVVGVLGSKSVCCSCGPGCVAVWGLWHARTLLRYVIVVGFWTAVYDTSVVCALLQKVSTRIKYTSWLSRIYPPGVRNSLAAFVRVSPCMMDLTRR